MKLPLLLLVAGTSATSVGPIRKVLQLLDELQGKVVKEGQTSQAQYESFVDWCGKQAVESKHSIDDGKETIEELTATKESAESLIEELKSEIEKSATVISTGENEHATAKSLRAKEHADFVQQDADLGTTVDMLARAHSVLSKSQGAVQTAAVQESLLKLTSTLRSVVAASLVSVEDKDLVTALIQKVQDPVALFDDSQPQANELAFEGSSGSILDTMDQLREKAETSRSELQKEEVKAAHSFEMFEQATLSELAAQQAQLETAKKRVNLNEEIKAKSIGDLQSTEQALAASEKFLEDTQTDCMEKAHEFETQAGERGHELTVLQQATKILAAQGEPALVQAPSFVQVRASVDLALDDRQVAASKYLRRESGRLQSWVLTQVADKLSSEPFAKVRDMITGMVEKLRKEEAEESSQKAWCDEENAKTTKSLDSKGDRVEQLTTRMEKTQAGATKLEEQAATLVEEIQSLDVGMKDATEMRQAESAEFVRKSAEYTTGQKACAAAIKVLREYYEGKSFVQTQSTSLSLTQEMQSATSAQPMAAFGGGGDSAQPSAASGIIGLLEVAESDFSGLVAEGQAAEDDSVAEFEKLQDDSKVARATKAQGLKNTRAERQRLESVMADVNEDLADASKELDAVTAYQSKLKSTCETKTPAFKERQERRNAEIEGLQHALGVLDGSDVALIEAPRTSKFLGA